MPCCFRRLAPEPRRGSRQSASRSSGRSHKEPSQEDFSSSDDRSTVEYRKVTRQNPATRTKTHHQVAPSNHSKKLVIWDWLARP